jgi:hypothetical protein
LYLRFDSYINLTDEVIMSTRPILSEQYEDQFWAIFGYAKDEILSSEQHDCTRKG